MHPTCLICAEAFATNLNAPTRPVMIHCGHVMCRRCANILATAHMPCPSRCSAQAVQRNDIVSIALTYEQAGNVATANTLIERRVTALREEQRALDQACLETFMRISQVEPLVNVQRGRIRRHAEILADLARTRSRARGLLDGCHSVLDEISTVQLELTRGRTNGRDRPRKRALSFDSARDDGYMSDRPVKRL